MRSRASARNSSIRSLNSTPPSPLARRTRSGRCCARPTVEDVDRQVVVHAERQRCRVHHPQAALDRLVVGDVRQEGRVSVLARVDVVDALHVVLGHQYRLRVDLERSQRGGGVGREERVARAGGEDHDAALLEVAHRAPPDVGLRDLLDRDRGQHARVRRLVLERVLQRKCVQDGGEHAHVVGGRAVHPLRGALQAAVDVAAAHDDRDLHPAVGHALDLVARSRRAGRARRRTRDRRAATRRRASAGCAGKRVCRLPRRPLFLPPTTYRVKRRITTFSPVLLASSWRSCSIVLAVVLVLVDVLLVEQHDLLVPLAQPPLDDLRARPARACPSACSSKIRDLGGPGRPPARRPRTRTAAPWRRCARPRRARTPGSRRCAPRSRSRSRPRRARRSCRSKWT